MKKLEGGSRLKGAPGVVREGFVRDSEVSRVIGLLLMHGFDNYDDLGCAD